MLDHEGYLSFFQRVLQGGKLILLTGKRIFTSKDVSLFDSIHRPKNKSGGLLRMNDGSAVKSGRRKFCFADWDLDGRLDILVNSRNISLLRNVSTDRARYLFKDMGMVDSHILAGHTTSPTIVDWNKDGIPDLLAGAEDGFFYYIKNPNAKVVTGKN